MQIIQLAAPTAEPIALAEAKNHLRILSGDTTDDILVGALITAARQHAEMVTRRALVAQQWKLVMDQFPAPGMNISSANWYGPQWGNTPGPLSVVRPDGKTGYEIYLPRPSLQSIDSIYYIDATTGLKTLLDQSQYIVDLVSEPARIAPAYGVTWPSTQNQINAVEVTFRCGYSAPITADHTTGQITVSGWKTLVVGDSVRFSNSGGALPAPLVAATDYYIQSVVSPGVYKVSVTSGGAAITLTSDGTGLNFLGEVPAGVRAWMLVRVGSLYENREEVALMTRGKLEPLPFIDSLLDPFRVVTF